MKKENPMNKEKPWLFVDLDGTLTNTIRAARKQFLAFGQKYHLKLGAEDFAYCDGLTIPEIATYLKTRGKIPKRAAALAQEYEQSIAGLYVKSRPQVDSKQALAALKKAGWHLALVTSTPKRLAQDFLNQNGLDKLFSFVASAREVKRGKPHSDVYQLAIKRAGPGYYLALEDSAN